jgi:hypothetical protein
MQGLPVERGPQQAHLWLAGVGDRRIDRDALKFHGFLGLLSDSGRRRAFLAVPVGMAGADGVKDLLGRDRAVWIRLQRVEHGGNVLTQPALNRAIG